MRIAWPAVLILGLTLDVAAQDSSTEKQRALGQTRYSRGIELLARERFEQAATEFRGAIAAWPVFPMAYYGLGQARMNLKRFKDALDAFVTCRDQFQQQSLDALKGKGAAEGRRQEEIQGLRDSVAILRRNATLAGANARAIREMEDRIRKLENSRTDFEDPSAQTPAFVMLSIGSAYFRLGSLPEAEREYRNAVTTDPGFGEAHNNLAVIYMLTGRLDQADQEVVLAEKNGFKVNPQLKEDLKKRRGK